MNRILPILQSAALALLFASMLSGCATATRGSQTYFAVNTLPAGAKVFTDKQKSSQARGEFFGCPATPCEIAMSRRSQFNVMVTKDGYSPFFYVVQKRSHKELKKDKVAREAFYLDTYGEIISKEQLSKNAGLSPDIENTPASAAAATAVGIWYTGEIVSAIATAGTITAPAAAVVAGPILMTGYGIDLTSGALIDLTPNPMIVKLAPEQDATETKRLKAAFMTSRDTKAGR